MNFFIFFLHNFINKNFLFVVNLYLVNLVIISISFAFRGASAINWTLIKGDEKAGLTVFWADHGLDTGPILLQKSIKIEENDTSSSLYARFLYPEGVKAMVFFPLIDMI